MCPKKLLEEIGSLVEGGSVVSPIEHGGQCFVRANGIMAPTPPWSAAAFDILIAVPMAYDTAGLDAFYLRQPYSFNGGTHPRVKNGQKIELQDTTWQLVSWHYPEGKLWIPGQDDLASHLEHCRGFFLNRKAINAIE